MLNRRQLLMMSSASAFFAVGSRESAALGGTAAISSQITGPVRLRMRATSTTTGTHWGIYVQEVVIVDGKIVPVALIACFEFGRKQDPFVYPELLSTPAPIVTPLDRSYKIAVYFFENRDVALQPHDDASFMANRFESSQDGSGRTASMKASSWDHGELPSASIHEISIGFEYPDTAVPAR